MAQQGLLSRSPPSARAGFVAPRQRIEIPARASFGRTMRQCAPLISLIHPRASASLGIVEGGVKDESENLTLDAIRDSLIQQEDNIIFSLIERAQYKMNTRTYDPNRFRIPGFDGSLVEFMLKETECLHAKVRRYCAPDEHAFFPDDLPEPILPPLEYPKVLHQAAKAVNINTRIWKMYYSNLLPSFVSDGDDGNYGSTAVCDVKCLQALSKRIHYGKFVAEAKFRESPHLFEPHIRAQDPQELMKLVTFESVEASVQKRVEHKARTYGQEIDANGTKPTPLYKVEPKLVARLYGDWVMPLTKDVQVEYLLRRLD
ncbi:chorismate mutase 1, chloroplastic isoform X1 [Selaginella moellendorffii]|uniref:chorismate mutase 1, chloroplastic isoform X1 n=2 Tax=Selaginella moellendorffii TaxID=88036 RepID=UPI000D1CE460|nr:chorismate mutase 1, chloroplastic isoform X1 [Selaginella moellendorffii]XP_024538048.1 chorismate mutase 1, chloroplastic isoform X1 [Selaginella moellendorffii]|eukprot:XP_024538042.1 chorismate mutase 1, chloroplastic isoform X1 [Selaginella moellendorffii]